MLACSIVGYYYNDHYFRKKANEPRHRCAIDSQATCTESQTCCRAKVGWRCCDGKNAVCCSDGLSCCSFGDVCDIENKTCKKKYT